METMTIDAITPDWARVAEELDAQGHAVLPGVLGADECAALRELYRQPELFRSRVLMQRHGFGQGEYQYFAYPLPQRVAELRGALYAPLAEVANRWHEWLGNPVRFPREHADFLARCHAAGQDKPTPLMLQYQAGDYNCLHQDLYGEHVFPLQVVLLLSRPGEDFSGGELVLTEQRPRMQSRAAVMAMGMGDAVVLAVNHRPVQGTRGAYRVTMRHGVSALRSGRRQTLGLIFHDAA